MLSAGDFVGWVTRLLTGKQEPIPEQPPLIIDKDGWLAGDGVTIIKSHQSWFGHGLAGALPGGTVVHDSDTPAGTAINMAKRRARPFGQDPNDRMASWHVSVEQTGAIVQMISLREVAWHAHSNTAMQIPGLGWANYRTNGIELVGNKEAYTDAQVWAYARLLRAIVQWAGIPRQFAMIPHATIDPKRRGDGKTFAKRYAERVLDYAYAP